MTIYAVKNLDVNATDEELEFEFNVAEALGVTHVTAELPAPSPTSAATLKRIGDYALKRKIYAAYHTHTQGSMTVFDEAFAASQGNRSNVDFGHFVAAGGDPLPFLAKFHERIASFHLKDRTRPEHCELNLAWGQGETPIKEILRMVQKNKWTMPATIQTLYRIPEGSDAPKEVRKCLESLPRGTLVSAEQNRTRQPRPGPTASIPAVLFPLLPGIRVDQVPHDRFAAHVTLQAFLEFAVAVGDAFMLAQVFAPRSRR